MGALAGEEVPDEVWFREHGWDLLANPATGHKTGAYLDQRDSRAAVASP